MPIYTYRCTECGIQFERHQNFTDSPLVKCPECGKKSLKKVFTPAGIIFKGSGWYSTDNKSPSGQTASREKKPEAPIAETKMETKTESTPSENKKSSES